MRNYKYFGVILLLVVGFIGVTTLRTTADTCTQTVTNTNDSGNGSLRQALTNANTSSNTDDICFSIPGSGVQTINVLSQLPPVTQPAIIDGTTQSGYSGTPLIEINGASAGSNQVPGIWITNGGSTVKGLIVNRFSGDGIVMTDVGGNTISGNYVGTNAAGTAGAGNGQDGVGMLRSANNVIGGTTSATRNVVAGNGGNGIGITQSSATGNVVEGNYVGTNASGTTGIANGGDAMLINASPNNTVGGTTGTTPGGACTGACNLFSGNTYNGLGVLDASGTTVQGNYIGTTPSGTVSLANGDIGIELQDSPNNTVGGTTPAARNLISGNIGAGLLLTGSSTTGNTVEGNYVGTDVSGNSAIPNQKMGISVGNSPSLNNGYARSNTIGGSNGTTPGGACTGACNLISGNNQNGIILSGGSGTGNNVYGNYVGTNVSGVGSISNGLDGIGILNSPNNNIGDGSAGNRNIISGNQHNGVIIASDGSTGNRIVGDYIGVGSNGDSLGNSAIGVAMSGGIDTAILGNDIANNGQLGIDIGYNGVTANDLGDGDSGVNEQQNFPEVYAAKTVGSTTKIGGTLNSNASTTYELDFFASSGCNAAKPNNYGEGQVYLGSKNVQTDQFGNITFGYSPPSAVGGGTYITSTATRLIGNIPAETSEFSRCALVNSSKPAVTNGASWYLKDDLTPGSADRSFGYGFPATLLMCAWDPSQPGVKLPVVVAGNTWYLRASYTTGTADLTFQYGFPGTTPVCGDWDGDGVDTPGIVSGNETWYLRNSNSAGSADITFQYGAGGTRPVVGDWDGDGVDTIGTVDGNNNWSLRNSNNSGPANLTFQYGFNGATPLTW